jgi:drug/metabolite transporter (DMT)-like permease
MDFTFFSTEFLREHWIFLAFLAPIFWSMVNVIDVYFVGGIYKDEIDGAVIISLFQIIPFTIIALFFLDAGAVNWLDPALGWAIVGGIFFTLSFYFYFKALFHHNDNALLQIMWALNVVVVSLLVYFLWGEQLSAIKYLGIAVTLAGATLISFNKKIKAKFSVSYLKIIAGAIVFFSLSMVCMDRAYTLLEAQNLSGNQSFLLGFMIFAGSAFLSGVIFGIIKKRNPWPFLKKYWPFFLLLEGVTFLGNICSQRAISVAPSVAFVATIETFGPVFILIYSAIILFILPRFGRFKNNPLFSQIYQEQLEGKWIKIFATIIMAGGVYLIS